VLEFITLNADHEREQFIMASQYQHIAAREQNGVLVVSVNIQRLSSYELAEAMGRELLEAVSGKPAPKVVVDLSKLAYLSSVGYGPLITLRSRVRESGGRLVLCGLSGVVKEMFEATRLLINPNSPKSLFEFKQTVDESVAALSAN
jgi:anti-sigma B factor antagonist